MEVTKVAKKPLTPLRQMRAALNDGKGMSAKEVARKVAELLGEEKRTGESIAMIERRGTVNWKLIQALSQFYNTSLEEMAALADKKNNLYN